MNIVFEVLIFGVLGLIFFIYAGYPLILFILGLFIGKRRGSSTEAYYPEVIFIISVYNEERIIRDKIENTLQFDYPKEKLKIVVASDGSSDSTNRIVGEYKDQNIILKTFKSRRGKSATINKVMLDLKGDIVVFSDANAFYRRDAVKKLVRNFRDEEVGCVVGHLIYMGNNSYVSKGEGLYWRYELFLNQLESKLGSVLVGTGPIFAIRRKLFKPVLTNVANDFQLPAEVASSGYSVIYEKEAIAYEKSTYFFREEFARKKRIIVRGLTGLRGMGGNFGGPLRMFQFITRKLLRWSIGPMLPILYFSNLMKLDSTLFSILFVLQNIFYAMAAIGALMRRGRVKSTYFLIPFYFVMVNLAALVALLKYVSGGRLASWEKAETTRDIGEKQISSPSLKIVEGKGDISLSEKCNELENVERIT